MDRANHALASYLAAGAEVRLLSHGGLEGKQGGDHLEQVVVTPVD
jgi:hypothetical protein